MELIEFVKLDATQVRKDKELMQLFVKFYEAAFSFTPKCAGCSFKSGFKKLRKHVLSGEKNIIFDKTTTTMELQKTFILKNEYKTKILTYKKDGVTYRKYGNLMTEDFAKELVKHGKTEMFAKLPEIYQLKGKPSNEGFKGVNLVLPSKYLVSPSKYDEMHHQKELLPLYSEVKERTGKKALSNRKADIIAFLIENEA